MESVSAKAQGPELVLGLAQEVAFAEEIVAVPGEGLAFGAVAPANERGARGGRSDREIFETQDLFDHRSVRGVHAGERSFTRREIKLRLVREGCRRLRRVLCRCLRLVEAQRSFR